MQTLLVRDTTHVLQVSVRHWSFKLISYQWIACFGLMLQGFYKDWLLKSKFEKICVEIYHWGSYPRLTETTKRFLQYSCPKNLLFHPTLAILAAYKRFDFQAWPWALKFFLLFFSAKQLQCTASDMTLFKIIGLQILTLWPRKIVFYVRKQIGAVFIFSLFLRWQQSKSCM